MEINKPCTVYVRFTDVMPKLFVLFDTNTNEIYYFRHLSGRIPRIKFNIVDAGKYDANVPFEITNIRAIEIPDMWPTLPPPERDRYKSDTQVKYNPTLNGVASIYTLEGVIEVGKEFYQLPKPIRLFVLLHEKWHYFYKTEQYCDLGALIDFLRMGYNRSTAFYALSEYLGRTPETIERLKSMLNNIQKTQTNKL